LKESEIQICEADASQKRRIITPYLTKWEKYLKATVSEMNIMVEKSPLFAGGGGLIASKQICCFVN